MCIVGFGVATYMVFSFSKLRFIDLNDDARSTDLAVAFTDGEMRDDNFAKIRRPISDGVSVHVQNARHGSVGDAQEPEVDELDEFPHWKFGIVKKGSTLGTGRPRLAIWVSGAKSAAPHPVVLGSWLPCCPPVPDWGSTPITNRGEGNQSTLNKKFGGDFFVR